MASPNVTFDQIPSSTRTPGVYVEFNARLASNSLPSNRQSVRLVGQKYGTTTVVAANTPTELFSDDEAAQLFGYGSQLHLMARAALRANPYVSLCAVAVTSAAGSTSATGTVTVAGTATASGRLVLWIGGDYVAVAVAVGDTAVEVATALADAIVAAPHLPALPARADAVITLTAKNYGLPGNDIGLAAESVAGLTVTVAAMSGGAGVPDLGNALTAIFAAGDDVLVMPYRDSESLTTLREHLNAAGGGLEMRGAVGVVGTVSSYGSAVALAESINCERVLPVWLPGTRSTPMELAAAMAAVLAFEEDPARPLNGLELVGIDVPAVSKRALRTQIEGALHNGVTPLHVGPGEKVQIVRAVSSYTVNASGIDDPAWLDITTIRTLDYVRTAVRQRLALRFPRDKATARTLRQIRSEVLDVLLRLEALEILENVAALKDRVVVELDSQEKGRVNVRVPADVVNGLHVVAAVIDLIL